MNSNVNQLNEEGEGGYDGGIVDEILSEHRVNNVNSSNYNSSDNNNSKSVRASQFKDGSNKLLKLSSSHHDESTPNRSPDQSSKLSSKIDVFHVEEQATYLQEEQNAAAGDRSHDIIIWKPKESITKRICNMFRIRGPKRLFESRFIEYAKTGDLLLLSSHNHFEGANLSDSVLRGVKHTVDGSYVSKRRFNMFWNDIGIIVCLGNGQGEQVKMVLQMSETGLLLTNLMTLIRASRLKKISLALRPLQMKREYHNFASSLEDICLACKNNFLSLDAIDVLAGENGNKSQLFFNISNIIKKSVEKVGKIILHHQNCELKAEATRLFYIISAMANVRNVEDSDEISSSFEKIKFKDFKFGVEKIFSEDITIEQLKMQGIINKIVTSLDGENNSTVKKAIDLDEFLRSFDAALGQVDSNESSRIVSGNSEVDTVAILSAEFVLHLYHSFGLIASSAIDPKTYFHPQSFSSAQHIVSNANKVKDKQPGRTSSIDTSSVAAVPTILGYLHRHFFPPHVKFTRDILLEVA